MQIHVPFNKKQKARDLGAVFNRVTRTWNCDEDITVQLTACERADSEDINTATNENIEVIHQSENLNIVDIDWEEVLGTNCNLLIAWNIQKYGMPASAELRAKILKFLSYRKNGEYPINYDGMIECSEDFRTRYPEEYLCRLVESCITGAKSYEEEIRQSNLTDEEKALLYFALPFES